MDCDQLEENLFSLMYKIVAIVIICLIFIITSGSIFNCEIPDNSTPQEKIIDIVKEEINKKDKYVSDLIECQKELEKQREIEEQKLLELEEKLRKEEEYNKKGVISKQNYFNGDKEYIKKIIWDIAEQENLPVGYLYGIAMIETGGTLNPNTVGPKTRYGRAEGLMQIMPSTAKGLGITNTFDPYQSVKGAADYLNNFINTYSGKDIKDQNGNILDVRLIAVIGYNAGPSRITNQLKKNGYINILELPKETINYLKKLEDYY